MKKRKQTSIIAASLLAFFCFSYFVAGQVQTAVNKNIFGDTDQDGLGDSEEVSYGTKVDNPDTDGDGYSDGVEVKSGYDPLKPAPGDRVNVSSVNNNSSAISDGLTENFSATISEFFASKENSQEQISVDDVNNLVTENLSEKIGGQITFDTLPKLDRASLKIKAQDYGKLSEEERANRLKEDKDKYLKDLLYLLFTNAPQTITSSSDFDSFKNTFNDKLTNLSSKTPDYAYFRDFASKLDVATKQASEMEVPESFVDLHIKLLQLVNGYLALRDPSLPSIEDPVTRIIVMSRARMLIDLTGTYFKEANELLSKTK